MSTQDQVTCSNCGKVLDESMSLPSELRQPCPECSSLTRTFRVHLHDTVTVHDQMKMRASHAGEKKWFYEGISGSDLHRKSGKWMHKERSIDRDKDHYFEKITDPTTGEVVHQCDEPLSKHTGHGSAKKPNNG